MNANIEDVRRYWDSHLNQTQFLSAEMTPGSDEFYQTLEKINRYEYKPPLLREFAEGCAGQKLLEVGCGLGLELAQLAELGFEVTGVDLAPRAIKICQGYLEFRNVSGRVMVQNAENMDLPANYFDAIYSSGVIFCTPDIKRAIAEIWRVLRPGGRILIIFYHRRSWFYLLQRISHTNFEFETEDAPIINTYTKAEVRELFNRFSDIMIRTEYYYPTPTVRKGWLAAAYNRLFVPFMHMIPARFISEFGWHLVLMARKGAR